MTTTINIGLARNDGRADNTIKDVIDELGHALHYVTALRTVQSATEKTLVIQFDFLSLNETFAHKLCGYLAQDCIAVRHDNTGRGELVGPKAEAWGKFNPDLFFEIA